MTIGGAFLFVLMVGSLLAFLIALGRHFDRDRYCQDNRLYPYGDYKDELGKWWPGAHGD